MFSGFFTFLVILHWYLHLKEQSPLIVFFGLTLLRKDFHLKLAVSALVEWGAASLIWERAQWHNLCTAPSTEVSIGKDCRGLQRSRLWRSCKCQWYLGLLESSVAEAARVFLFSFYSLWEDVLAKGIPHGSRSGALALRAAVKLESGTYGTTTVPRF